MVRALIVNAGSLDDMLDHVNEPALGGNSRAGNLLRWLPSNITHSEAGCNSRTPLSARNSVLAERA